MPLCSFYYYIVIIFILFSERTNIKSISNTYIYKQNGILKKQLCCPLKPILTLSKIKNKQDPRERVKGNMPKEAKRINVDNASTRSSTGIEEGWLKK